MRLVIVTIDTEIHQDKKNKSVFPEHNKVFGVYSDIRKAYDKVTRYFLCGNYVTEDDELSLEEYDDSYRYTDKKHKGYAIYRIKYNEVEYDENEGSLM